METSATWLSEGKAFGCALDLPGTLPILHLGPSFRTVSTLGPVTMSSLCSSQPKSGPPSHYDSGVF